LYYFNIIAFTTEVNQAAKTVWGMVRVKEIRRNGQHVCQALHWNLANELPPTLYLAPEAFSLMSLKPGVV